MGGKPSKGTRKDKRLKRNRVRRGARVLLRPFRRVK